MTDKDSTFDKLKGKAKEMGGKATGNDRMEAEGKADQAKGKAQEMGNKAKDKAAGVKDSFSHKDDDNA